MCQYPRVHQTKFKGVGGGGGGGREVAGKFNEEEEDYKEQNEDQEDDDANQAMVNEEDEGEDDEGTIEGQDRTRARRLDRKRFRKDKHERYEDGGSKLARKDNARESETIAFRRIIRPI
eukprot:749080-Hanusia_phi.AAC.2